MYPMKRPIRTTARLHLLKSSLCLLIAILVVRCAAGAQGVGGLVVNLAVLDGVALTPENIFSYNIQATGASPAEAMIKGTLRYRQSALAFSYSFRVTLRPGINRIDGSSIRPDWTFSSAALKELFMGYHVLPEGTYEYCVSVNPLASNGEVVTGGEISECLYNKSEDLFLIALLDPENNARIYEHYPVFSWVVNYPFASQLTYRIRVAEIKEGQNIANAVARNNPVYTESNLPQTTTTYPVYGSPLKTAQPYGWTVDAYYKGILLGGAEPWKFTIVEDSELKDVPREMSYYEFESHIGDTRLYAVGELKLKFVNEQRKDTMLLSLYDDKGKEVPLSNNKIALSLGDNRILMPLKEEAALRHKKKYTLNITLTTGRKFQVPFTYINPAFLQ